jgi:hypothetical protein
MRWPDASAEQPVRVDPSAYEVDERRTLLVHPSSRVGTILDEGRDDTARVPWRQRGTRLRQVTMYGCRLPLIGRDCERVVAVRTLRPIEGTTVSSLVGRSAALLP